MSLIQTQINIIGVDPGKTTGIALYNVRGFQSYEVSGETAVEFIENRARIRAAVAPLLIVCERWIVGAHTAKHSAQGDAANIIGALDDFAKSTEHVTMELQSASDAKHACTSHTLKQLGWFTPRLGHANDAGSHVGLAMLKYHSSAWLHLINVLDSDQHTVLDSNQDAQLTD